MCPTLRYIKIGHDLAWEVLRPNTEHVGLRTRSKELVSLRELDIDEIQEIELFMFTDFPEQCGLLGRERNRESIEGKGPSISELNQRLVSQGLPPLPI